MAGAHPGRATRGRMPRLPDSPSLAAATKGPSGSRDSLSTGQDGRAADLQGISARASRGTLTYLATYFLVPNFRRHHADE